VALVALFNLAHTRRYPIPFLNARATKVGSLPFFLLNRLPWQHPLRYPKKRSRSIIYTQTLSFGEWIAKIGPADLEIICLGEIIKKDKKRKKNETRNAWQSLAYSPLGATVSPPSKTKP